MIFKPEKTTVGDFPYFIGLATTLLLGIAVYFLIKNKSAVFKKWFIFGLFMFNTVLHFLKIFNSYYQERLPEYYATITFDNICAVSAILFTLTYITKNKTLKDYMFYMGILSGLAALIYPTGGVINRTPYAFDYFRFYICHGIILFGPVYMVLLGLHKLDYRRIWKVPFVFWGVLTIIFINTIICAEMGITDIRSSNFLNAGFARNASLVFGISGDFENVSKILLVFVPDFLKTVQFGPYAGQFKCIPLLWILIPSYIYMFIIFNLLSMTLEFKKMKADFKKSVKFIKEFIKKIKRKEKSSAADENKSDGDIN